MVNPISKIHVISVLTDEVETGEYFYIIPFFIVITSLLILAIIRLMKNK